MKNTMRITSRCLNVLSLAELPGLHILRLDLAYSLNPDHVNECQVFGQEKDNSVLSLSHLIPGR